LKILIYSANFAPDPTGIGKYPAIWPKGSLHGVISCEWYARFLSRSARSRGSHRMGLLSNEFVRGIVLRMQAARTVDV
jgi:hypothetical protein